MGSRRSRRIPPAPSRSPSVHATRQHPAGSRPEASLTRSAGTGVSCRSPVSRALARSALLARPCRAPACIAPRSLTVKGHRRAPEHRELSWWSRCRWTTWATPRLVALTAEAPELLGPVRRGAEGHGLRVAARPWTEGPAALPARGAAQPRRPRESRCGLTSPAFASRPRLSVSHVPRHLLSER